MSPRPALIKINEIVPTQNQLVFSYFEINASPKTHRPDENKIKPKSAKAYLFINTIYNNLKRTEWMLLFY